LGKTGVKVDIRNKNFEESIKNLTAFYIFSYELNLHAIAGTI
jgi:hypothetical protein